MRWFCISPTVERNGKLSRWTRWQGSQSLKSNRLHTSQKRLPALCARNCSPETQARTTQPPESRTESKLHFLSQSSYLGPVTGGMGCSRRGASVLFCELPSASGSRIKLVVAGGAPRTPFFRFLRTSSLSTL